MKTPILITALAAAVATMGLSPAPAAAKPKHYKHYHKAHKNYYKSVNRYYNRSYYRPYRYERPKYDNESWGVTVNPGGGLGFYYSENSGRYPGYYW